MALNITEKAIKARVRAYKKNGTKASGNIVITRATPKLQVASGPLLDEVPAQKSRAVQYEKMRSAASVLRVKIDKASVTARSNKITK